MNNQKKEFLERRAATIQAIRSFFVAKGYVEIETPIALALPSQEPYLNPVPLVLTNDKGIPHSYCLRTSPEFALKKMLGAGFEKVFEIGKCFRDRESFGGTHQPEFTMLEWYSQHMTYGDLMDEVEELLKVAASLWGRQWPAVERFTLKELFKKHANIDLDDLDKCASAAGQTQDDYFYKVFLDCIEPQLPKTPVFLYEYPRTQAALARIKKTDPRYAERFELYINGIEIANAFGELLDPVEQRARFLEDQESRRKQGKPVYAIDEDFLQALSQIAEPASGIALGVDRLLMVLSGAQKIEDVVALPFEER